MWDHMLRSHVSHVSSCTWFLITWLLQDWVMVLKSLVRPLAGIFGGMLTYLYKLAKKLALSFVIPPQHTVSRPFTHLSNWPIAFWMCSNIIIITNILLPEILHHCLHRNIHTHVHICQKSCVCCLDYLGYTAHLDKVDATAARCWGLVRIYNWYAELFHLPRACMMESSRPAVAAVVAAPIWKLWPE